MRNKYKTKQLYLHERSKESKINDKEINNNHQKLNIQNNSILNSSKSIGKFHKILSINDAQKENKNTQFISKNASSLSFRKEMQNYNTFNKNFNEKNENHQNQQDENNNQKIIKKIKNFNNNNNKDNKCDIINKTNRIYNYKNFIDNYPLTKNNSQKLNTIFINKNKNNQILNNENKDIACIGYKLIEPKSIKDNNNNNKNYQKLNVIENIKNITSNSRNRNYVCNNDYFSNRKNKNKNKNNNNYSLNEKSNSLSIISEKISLLNSYEDNSNSMKREDKDNLKEKNLSSKIKNDNSERNSSNNYFNIIESDIQEENENYKNDKSLLQKNTKEKTKTKIIYEKKNYEENKSISILTPNISHNKRHYKNSNSINETDINTDNKKNNINNSEDISSIRTISSININNRTKKDVFSLNKKEKNPSDYFNSLKELNDNINSSSNMTENNDNVDKNKNSIKHNKTINLNDDSISKIKKRWKIKKNNESLFKEGNQNENENENENINNKEKELNKEKNIVTNNYVENYKSEDNIKPFLIKKNQSLPLKSFKFLVHQANYNDLIKYSFNKYYEANKKSANNTNSINNNMNESLTLSTETNFSGKVKYNNNNNNNILSDLLDFSKRDYLKSPMSNISNFCYNKDEFSVEENIKNKPKISIKQKLIKTSKSDYFNNAMNTSFDSDKNNFKYNNFFSNKINKRKYTNEIINNNIYSTTLNIYKINDNDDISHIKSILTPSVRRNILYKSNNNSNNNLMKIDNNNNINNNNCSQNNSKINNIIPTIIYSDNSLFELFFNSEKKILSLINKIDDYKVCKNECYDYIKYYFEHKIDEFIIKLFLNNHNRINIINYIKIEILCYLLCYDISYSQYYNQAVILIKSIINILNNNFLLIILLALSNYNKNISEKNKELSYKEKIIISELNEIIKNNLTIRIDEDNLNELYVIQSINNNTKNINNYYKMILDNLYKEYYSIKNIYNNNKYKFPNCLNNSNYNNIDKKIIVILFFYDSYRLLNNYNLSELKKFFDSFLDRTKIYNYETETNQFSDEFNISTSTPLTTNSSIKSIVNKKKDISLFKNKQKFFILPDINKNKYKYSLIMPLNEVLIYFNKNNNGYIIRPGLFEFLNEMKELFELILFTTDFSNYEEQIIENIQKGKNIFDYILNRNHGIDNANSFIQDLIALNRNVKQFIIIDSSLNRFKTHKSNILYIKPFYGDIKNDNHSLNFLSELLHRIQIDCETTEDIRISINKYRKSFIYSKITK